MFTGLLSSTDQDKTKFRTWLYKEEVSARISIENRTVLANKDNLRAKTCHGTWMTIEQLLILLEIIYARSIYNTVDEKRNKKDIHIVLFSTFEVAMSQAKWKHN
jgi:hypothetical protein